MAQVDKYYKGFYPRDTDPQTDLFNFKEKKKDKDEKQED